MNKKLVNFWNKNIPLLLMIHHKNCKYCGKSFVAKRKDKVYCSQSCKITDWQRERFKEAKQLKQTVQEKQTVQKRLDQTVQTAQMVKEQLGGTVQELRTVREQLDQTVREKQMVQERLDQTVQRQLTKYERFKAELDEARKKGLSEYDIMGFLSIMNKYYDPGDPHLI